MGRIRGMYQIWLSRGRGLEAGPRFAQLKDAIGHAKDLRIEASCGIRRPGGDWYRWPDSGEVMLWRSRPRPR